MCKQRNSGVVFFFYAPVLLLFEFIIERFLVLSINIIYIYMSTLKFDPGFE